MIKAPCPGILRKIPQTLLFYPQIILEGKCSIFVGYLTRKSVSVFSCFQVASHGLTHADDD
jgi:hypothetical protein